MRFAVGHLAFAALLFVGDGALAQDLPAYETGIRLAQRRGYDDAECYGRVFAKHAVVVEHHSGRKSWFAASTPAYNAELQRRCGVDRLGDLRQRRAGASSGRAGSAYRAGLRVATQRGYAGEQAACFARTYAHFAYETPVAGSPRGYAVAGGSSNAYRAELFRSCGISR
ncbi:hypothetical protein [Bosea sp. CS1GBMeth4]|uniref:hypothetical protein n=1 Tax=Bosea sp. CS1GBMeth4 TaxID=1892849 RepID=UPI001647EFD0|nr:hypothetical protein [Bosea sp. CS1GBMeth4]